MARIQPDWPDTLPSLQRPRTKGCSRALHRRSRFGASADRQPPGWEEHIGWLPLCTAVGICRKGAAGGSSQPADVETHWQRKAVNSNQPAPVGSCWRGGGLQQLAAGEGHCCAGGFQCCPPGCSRNKSSGFPARKEKFDFLLHHLEINGISRKNLRQVIISFSIISCTF